MDGFLVVLIILMLLLGALAGAVCAAVPARRHVLRLQHELDDAVSRLGSAGSELAAATAENRLLTAQAGQAAARSTEDQSVLRALGPVAEKLEQVRSQVGLLERDRAEQFGRLARQLQEARDSDAVLLSTTHSLASALRSNSARGQWGEVQLRRVVEASGMLRRVDFVEQSTITVRAADVGSTDTSARPDMVVHLPGNKQLVVDSKVPLAAFLAAQELPEDPPGTPPVENGAAGRRAQLLDQHAKALRAHIDALARKKYWEGTTNSPELVVCFIPVESVLASALSSDPGLLDYAFARNVALASPVSLLAILKGTAFSWRQAVLTENARELFELSRELYDRLGTMGEHLSRLGGSLKSSVERYNSFVGTLESRVLPTARRINAFDSASLEDEHTGNTHAKGSASSGGARAIRVSAVESTPRLLSAPELLEGNDAARGERSA